MTRVKRDSKGLTDALFDELELLRAGDSAPQKATAVARLASTICKVVHLEMEFARFIAPESLNDQAALKALPMGLGKPAKRR